MGLDHGHMTRFKMKLRKSFGAAGRVLGILILDPGHVDGIHIRHDAFKIIGFFYRTYKANRARVDAFKSNPKVSAVLKLITVLIFVGWILTWMLASEESRTRLTDEIKQSLGDFEFGRGQ